MMDGGGLAIHLGRDGPVVETVAESRGRWPWVPPTGPGAR
jgi:hypothetical protein